MGTDIIYHAEKRLDEKWVEVKDANGEREFFYFGAERNYDLYEILCGSIEPETGLTSRGFEPIAPMRGVPVDYPSNRGGDDDASSWVLLKELIDFPWMEKLRHFAGYANARNFKLFLENGRFRFSPVSPRHPYSPHSFPRPEWEVVTNDEMLDLITSETVVPDNVYTHIEFSRTYAQSAPHVLSDTIPKLLKFGDPEDIRIVFSFFC